MFYHYAKQLVLQENTRGVGGAKRRTGKHNGKYTRGEEGAERPTGKYHVEGWTLTRTKLACGCFVPDLTGLTRRPSNANLPGCYMGVFIRLFKPIFHLVMACKPG